MQQRRQALLVDAGVQKGWHAADKYKVMRFARQESSRRRESERGQMIPLLALGLVTLMAVAALGVDIGYWRSQQRTEQSAADAAAIAGAIRAYYPTTAGTPAPVEVKAAAIAAASSNGIVDDGGVGNITVTVNDPPTNNTPPNAQATPYGAGAVEVIVAKNQPTFFSAVFGRTSQVVTTRAVAARAPDNGIQCLTQVDASSGLVFNAGNIDAVNCSVATNGSVSVGRGIDANAVTYYGSPPQGSTTKNGQPITPIHSTTPVVDPCFKISGCNYLQNTPIPPLTNGAIDATGRIIISGAGFPSYNVVKNCCSGAATFTPGLYYIYGGISGTVLGTGVTLVNVNGQVGSGSSFITAPSTFGPPDNAPTAGVAFYQPPNNTNYITNNGKSNTYVGLFYAPSAHFRSNGKLDKFSDLIIGGFQTNGNKTLTIDPSLNAALTLQASQATTHVALTE